MGYRGEQKREYDRQWMKRRRQEWIDSQGGKCVKCGSTDNIEIDHIDPATKKHQVSTLWSRAKAVRGAELAKCQLLCADCHLEKTKLDLAKPITHGDSGYRRKCRCIVCKKAHSNRLKRYRSK